MIYFVLALAVFFAALIDSSREKSIQGVKTFSTPFLLILFPCILIFLGGFRWLTGTDWNNYYHFYVWHDNWQTYNNGEFEFLYTVLNFICKQNLSKKEPHYEKLLYGPSKPSIPQHRHPGGLLSRVCCYK